MIIKNKRGKIAIMQILILVVGILATVWMVGEILNKEGGLKEYAIK